MLGSNRWRGKGCREGGVSASFRIFSINQHPTVQRHVSILKTSLNTSSHKNQSECIKDSRKGLLSTKARGKMSSYWAVGFIANGQDHRGWISFTFGLLILFWPLQTSDTCSLSLHYGSATCSMKYRRIPEISQGAIENVFLRELSHKSWLFRVPSKCHVHAENSKVQIPTKVGWNISLQSPLSKAPTYGVHVDMETVLSTRWW
jgi:hypothetical protein